VKAKALLLFVSFACASTAYTFGQVDCSTSKKLVCEFPISATTLAANTVGNASGSFGTVFQLAETASRPFNASIATQLTQLPVPSAAIGTVFFKQKGKEAPVSFENLGPILTDRPDTVGKNHLFVGFSYQHFNFNSLDGASLGSLPAGFTFSQTSTSNKNDVQTFYGAESNNVGFKLDQYVGVLTYGLTKKTDISLVVPFNSVSLSATATNFQAYEYDSASQTYTNLSPAAGTAAHLTGTAGGIGDVTVNVKQLLIGGEGRPAIAGGIMLRIPSGDALSYLGSGAVGGNVYGLFEYRKRLAPHLKLSYQWNGNSQVMNLQAAPNTRLPGGLQYAAGADFKVKGYLTLAGDLLGNQFVNTPSFTETTLSSVTTPATLPVGTGGPTSITYAAGLTNTYTTVNLSGGLKVYLGKGFLLYGNVLKQVNNVGLRSNAIPLVGIAFKR
jgi:hypothetical protein